MMELRIEHSFFGSWKTLIQYVGISWITVFIKISLPAWDKNFSFQPSTFFRTRLWIPSKVLILDRPTKAGKPKYFS